MRELVLDFARDAADLWDGIGPVIELGARLAEGQGHLRPVRTLFPTTDYIGCDLQAGPGVDRIEDVHALSFDDNSVGAALCLDTLEHVRDPMRAVEELHRVLRPGGLLAISSVMCFPIHAHPWDYWRFTPEGFALLLEPFRTSTVTYLGWEELPESVFGVGVKDADRALDASMLVRVSGHRDAWPGGRRVDLGPIRLSVREVWKLAITATAQLARDRAGARLGRSTR